MSYHPYPKRNSIKNYFPLPNEIYHLGLSSGAIAIYGYLLSIEDRKTYQCYASYKTIGRAVHMSENTVRKYVTELEEKRFIHTEPTVIRTKEGRARNGSLLYTIRPIQEAVDYFHERQMETLDESIARQKVQAKLSQACGPQKPLCAGFSRTASPSPAAPEVAEFRPFSSELSKTKEGVR